ncbi:MAG: uroporphyrinogen-III synthase [Acinetobacter sp.]
MLFVNTRPPERAYELTQVLRANHVHVIDLPLLQLTAIEPNEELKQCFADLPSTQVLIVVSPRAAEIGLSYLAYFGINLQQLKQLQWVAVGESTAQVLRQAGICPILPEIETSEGILKLPVFMQHKINKIAFWRGLGGRTLMLDFLQAQGHQILNFLLYQRSCPITRQDFEKKLFLQQHWQQHKDVYVCISSEASWLNWQNLCQNNIEIFKRCIYLTLGDRLTKRVQETLPFENIGHVIHINDLKPETIRHCLFAHKD